MTEEEYEKVIIPRRNSYKKYVKRKLLLQAICKIQTKLASLTRNFQTKYTLRIIKINSFLSQRL